MPEGERLFEGGDGGAETEDGRNGGAPQEKGQENSKHKKKEG